MGLRPARCYTSVKQRPFTRVAISVHEKNYIGTVPPLKIRQFNMGNPRKKYSRIVDLVAEQAVQIRDNAVEAARVSINRYLIKEVGKDNYFMRIRVFPHQVLREHKQAQGAGADRVSQGMSHSFGKPIGRAVRVRKGTILMSVLSMAEYADIVSKALLRAKAKFPCDVSVRIHKDVAAIGTRPKHAIEEIVEEEKPEEKEEEKAEAGEEKKEEAKEEGKEETKSKAQAEEKAESKGEKK